MERLYGILKVMETKDVRRGKARGWTIKRSNQIKIATIWKGWNVTCPL